MKKAKQKFSVVFTRHHDDVLNHWHCHVKNNIPLHDNMMNAVHGLGSTPLLAAVDMFESFGKTIWKFYECGDF